MKERIVELMSQAVAAARVDGVLEVDDADVVVEVERPRDASHGDYSANTAMRLAKPAKMSPRAIAEALVERLSDAPEFSAVEIAGPGFINFRLSDDALRGVVRRVHERGAQVGTSGMLADTKIQIEFVSCNPVGPMHVGHGRWASLGDSMARLLESQGATVEREFYINDAGVQMDTFAKSVAARYLEACGRTVEFAEDWYQGSYITDIATEIFEDEGDVWADAEPSEREEHFRERAYAQVLEHLARVLHDMGVDFDVWFSERTVHETDADGASEITRSIDALREAGHVYDEDGAVWFRTTTWGDDKDRVLKKADGSYTYFAADIAYHKDKFDRGFDRVIDIWGADHHGYVRRMEAAAAALGHEGKLELVIGQLVNLFRAGEVVRMSKRTGEMVTFEDLLDEVGVDAARYFFLRRSTDQPLDFDIALATEESAENPVYYVQYAHARICAIIRKAAGHAPEDDVAVSDALAKLAVGEDTDLSPLAEEGEWNLIRALEQFDEAVEWAAVNRAPHRMTRYAEELAASFHQFYTQCRVVGDDEALSAARLSVVAASRTVLERALSLLGVSAPERM